MYLKNGRFGPYIQYEIIQEVIEEVAKKKKTRKKKKKGDSSSNPEIEIDAKSILDYKILKYDDGFQILSKADKGLPDEIRLKVAYDLAAGDSFGNYSEFDFRLILNKFKILLT